MGRDDRALFTRAVEFGAGAPAAGDGTNACRPRRVRSANARERAVCAVVVSASGERRRWAAPIAAGVAGPRVDQ
ncbi:MULTISPECIES: hypothetical protein [Burkholderia]|uniref:Uncharacterized protein n=1 Tax=Burkholderia savannae TaxID=1637837 RepID=A0ABR5T6M5_9BURK|nr:MULTISPECIES: hypothetical protein [Burkholderia]AOK50242.1 hypothetical protein WT60_25810 [Burkholderia sp. MSMB617WGS]KVG91808.1 hypothetical protein WS82_13480 [Burkholderia sp. MSMB2041]KVK81823.1 hypothetical protein WS91_10540 [Burkholderia sp. MSMB1498]AOJ71784.1 hypothetical protein WS78_23700 [Burkholderia savannae]AOJ83506.1 hypothetical protein WS86_22845 [Burkholderia savannae]